MLYVNVAGVSSLSTSSALKEPMTTGPSSTTVVTSWSIATGESLAFSAHWVVPLIVIVEQNPLGTPLSFTQYWTQSMTPAGTGDST